MPDRKISELPQATAFTGPELIELVQGGVNKKGDLTMVQTLFGGSGTTRDMDRAYTSNLLFDHNYIEGVIHTQTDDITFTVADAGHLVDQESFYGQRIALDGVHPVYFDGFNHLSNVRSGQILDAGTYQFIFWYSNGIARVAVMLPSEEAANLIVLDTPENMAAAQDGETAIDVSWDNVTGNAGYQLYFSLTGGTGGWTSLGILAADTVTYKHTGLTAGDHRFYRVKAIGNQTTHADSNFAYADTTITAAGDTDAPVPAFTPADGNSTWTVNKSLEVDFDEAIRNTNATEVTNANANALTTLKQTNAAGADIPKTTTINLAKRKLIVDPLTHYGANQQVYFAVNNFEDVNGNEETSPQAITFTTTEYTYFNGVSAFVLNGDVLDTILTAANTNFWAEITINNFATTGLQRLICKAANEGAGGKCFSSYFSGSDVYFAYYMDGGGYRFIKWTGVLSAGERTLVFKYDGSVDTNNGLDRVTLEINSVVQGSKTLHLSSGSLVDELDNSNSPLSFGIQTPIGGTPAETYYFSGEAKNWIMRHNSGASVALNIANLRIGTDASGNGFNGTFQQ